VTQGQECGIIIDKMENKDVMEIKEPIFKEPVSATYVAEFLKIPYSVVSTWVSRKQVKVIKRDKKRGCFKNPVLLDPVTLQERIDKYKKRNK
jgi:hypothetical protein